MRQLDCDALTAYALADGRLLMACPRLSGDARWYVVYPGETGVHEVEAVVAADLVADAR